MRTDNFRAKSQELADLYRERADAQRSQAQGQAQLFRLLNDGSRSITAIREEISNQATPIAMEIIGMNGDIDALKVELEALRMEIEHG